MCKNIIIQGHQGLGDNIYQRPFVRSLCEQDDNAVFVKTPWPQLYHDFATSHGLKFLKWKSGLRTHSKNEDRFGGNVFAVKPCCYEHHVLGYTLADLKAGLGIIGSMESVSGIKFSGEFDFAPESRWLDSVSYFRQLAAGRPLAIFRPPTVRTEWRNEARNPCPTAMKRVIDAVCETHFVISVADLAAGEEWLACEVPPQCLQLHQGEMAIEELIALCSVADLLVGGPGFLMPLGVALEVETLIVFGGYHGPQDLVDSRLNTDHLHCVAPEHVCRCFDQHHDCKKHISDDVLLGAVGSAIDGKAHA